jgi:hypothetical protein
MLMALAPRDERSLTAWRHAAVCTGLEAQARHAEELLAALPPVEPERLETSLGHKD